MPERDLPGVAHEEVEPHRHRDVDTRHHEDVDEVLVGQEPGYRGHRRQEAQEGPAGDPAGQPVNREHEGP